jgi:hypothetical protein
MQEDQPYQDHEGNKDGEGEQLVSRHGERFGFLTL